MKEAANSLLKVLEEPPDFATIFLLAENAGELLPTIRSRSMTLQLRSLSLAEIEQYLAKHRPEWKPQQRALVAKLSEGPNRRARTFDRTSTRARDILTILRTALPNQRAPFVQDHRNLSCRGRRPPENRPAVTLPLFLAARPAVHRLGRSRTCSQYRYPAATAKAVPGR